VEGQVCRVGEVVVVGVLSERGGGLLRGWRGVGGVAALLEDVYGGKAIRENVWLYKQRINVMSIDRSVRKPKVARSSACRTAMLTSSRLL
jgi:hypothetical protein